MSSFGYVKVKGKGTITEVDWTTSRIGTMVTGYSMTVSGINIGDGVKVLDVDVDSEGFKLGDSKGIITSVGKSLSRNSNTEISVCSDPFGIFLGKIVVIRNSKIDGKKSVGTLVGNKDGIQEIEHSDFIKSVRNDYCCGNIEKFMETVFGSIPVTIDYSKIQESPIVKSLSNKNAGSNQSTAFDSAIKSDAFILNSHPESRITTVGDLISQYISAIGLEFYYIGESKYELCPPKILDSNSSDILEIPEDKVLVFDAAIDPHSAPDIIIPSMEGSDIIGSYYGGKTVKGLSLEEGLTKKGGNSGYVKIRTYNVPSLAESAYNISLKKIGDRREDAGKNDTTHSFESDALYENVVRSFFEDKAKKTSLFSVQTGTATLDIYPAIGYGYRWIKFKEKKYFIGSVDHKITRNKSVTVIQILGAEDNSASTGTEKNGTSIKSSTPSQNSSNKKKATKNKKSGTSSTPEHDDSKNTSKDSKKALSGSYKKIEKKLLKKQNPYIHKVTKKEKSPLDSENPWYIKNEFKTKPLIKNITFKE